MPRFQIRVTSVGPRNIRLIKTLRLVAHMSLNDAVKAYDYLRTHACVLLGGIPQEEADEGASLLRAIGAQAVAEPSKLDLPMVLCVNADELTRPRRRRPAAS